MHQITNIAAVLDFHVSGCRVKPGKFWKDENFLVNSMNPSCDGPICTARLFLAGDMRIEDIVVVDTDAG